MNSLISKLEQAEVGSRPLSKAVFEQLHPRPKMTWKDGAAPHKPPNEYGIQVLDTSVCDWCGAPAVKIIDLSLQLPDYRGYCGEHSVVVKAKQKAEFDWNMLDRPDYTTSLDAALTLVPEGCWYTLGSRNDGDISGGPWATIWEDAFVRANGEAATVPLAVVVASLKARE